MVQAVIRSLGPFEGKGIFIISMQPPSQFSKCAYDALNNLYILRRRNICLHIYVCTEIEPLKTFGSHISHLMGEGIGGCLNDC